MAVASLEWIGHSEIVVLSCPMTTTVALRSRGNNGTPRNTVHRAQAFSASAPGRAGILVQYPSPSNVTVGITVRSAGGSGGSMLLTRLRESERYCGMGQK